MALQGQAAIDFLQQGGYMPAATSLGTSNLGNTDFVSSKLGYEKPSIASGIAGLLSGITQPIRGTAQQTVDIFGALGQMGNWDEGKGDINNQKNIFLTDREHQDLQSNRLLGGIKQGAGIAAFGVPGAGAFGGGIKGAALGGAAGGALGGFAATEEGNEVGGTLTGALVGAGTGAALAGIGKGVNKVRGKSTKTAQQYTDDIIKKVEKKLGTSNNLDDKAFTRSNLFVDEIRSLPEDVQEDVVRNIFSDDVRPLKGINSSLTGKSTMTGGGEMTVDQVLGKLDKPRLTKGGGLFNEDDYATNKLQRWGKDLQYDAAGIRGSADVNTLTFADDAIDDKRSIDWAIKNTGLGDGPEGGVNIGTKDLADRLGKMRKDAVQKMDVKVTAGDLLDGLDERLSLNRDIDKGQARKLLEERLKEVGNSKAIKGIDSGNVMDLKNINPERLSQSTLDEKQLFDMTQKLGANTAEFWRLQRHATQEPSIKLEAAKLLDDKISSILETQSPEIGRVNRAFNALYRQKGGFIQAYDRNANISLTGGKAGIIQQLQNPAQRFGGKRLEQLGNLVENTSNVTGKLPVGITDNLSKLPTTQANKIAQRLLPLYMAQQSVDRNNSTNNNDNQMDTQTDDILDQFAATGNMDIGGQQGDVLGASTEQTSGVDPQRVFAQGVLSGELSPQQAQMAMQLLGVGGTQGGATGRPMPSSSIEKMAGSQASLAQLDQLQERVNNSGEFGPINSGAIRDVINNVPFLGGLFATPEREAIRTQTDMLAMSMAQALTTGALSDRDIAMFKSMMPNLSDQPAVANAKIDQVRSMLEQKIGSSQQGFNSAGYNPMMVQDPAQTPGYSQYQELY